MKLKWLKNCFRKETSDKVVNPTCAEGDPFEPLARGHRHICYTDCSRLQKQLDYTFPNRRDSDHHHAATVCSEQDLIMVLRDYYGLKVTVTKETGNQTFSQLCQNCEKNLPKVDTLRQASMLAPPLGVKKI